MLYRGGSGTHPGDSPKAYKFYIDKLNKTTEPFWQNYAENQKLVAGLLAQWFRLFGMSGGQVNALLRIQENVMHGTMRPDIYEQHVCYFATSRIDYTKVNTINIDDATYTQLEAIQKEEGSLAATAHFKDLILGQDPEFGKISISVFTRYWKDDHPIIENRSIYKNSLAILEGKERHVALELHKRVYLHFTSRVDSRIQYLFCAPVGKMAEYLQEKIPNAVVVDYGHKEFENLKKKFKKPGKSFNSFLHGGPKFDKETPVFIQFVDVANETPAFKFVDVANTSSRTELFDGSLIHRLAAPCASCDMLHSSL